MILFTNVSCHLWWVALKINRNKFVSHKSSAFASSVKLLLLTTGPKLTVTKQSVLFFGSSIILNKESICSNPVLFCDCLPISIPFNRVRIVMPRIWKSAGKIDPCRKSCFPWGTKLSFLPKHIENERLCKVDHSIYLFLSSWLGERNFIIKRKRIQYLSDRYALNEGKLYDLNRCVSSHDIDGK